MNQLQKELLGQFGRLYPRCAALPILPVPTSDGKGFQDGYDSDDLLGVLGQTRYNKLIASLPTVFCCAHRLWPANHATPSKRNAEVHCIYSADLEKFLAGGN
jgi:hypothetical protein